MCAKEQGGGDPDDNAESEPEHEKLFARISSEHMENLESYAEQRSLSKAKAVEQMIEIVTGSEGVGEGVREMRRQLDTVLQELNAPGVGSEISEGDIMADGATRAQIDYNELSWSHSEPLTRDMADWSSSVKQTPNSRAPVLRGILLEEVSGERVHRSRVVETAQELYGCAPQTAEGYIRAGMYKSWYPCPQMDLERSGEGKMLAEELRERGATIPGSKSSLSDLFRTDMVEIGAEEEPLWTPSEKLFIDREVFYAKILQTLSRLRESLIEQPESAKYGLLLRRVLTYAKEHDYFTSAPMEQHDSAGEWITALEEEQGISLPQTLWWE